MALRTAEDTSLMDSLLELRIGDLQSVRYGNLKMSFQQDLNNPISHSVYIVTKSFRKYNENLQKVHHRNSLHVEQSCHFGCI